MLNELNEINENLNNLTISDSIINKGTGAGGCNTNKNGLPYEKLTELKEEYKIINSEKHYKKIKFNNSNKEFITVKQSGLFK